MKGGGVGKGKGGGGAGSFGWVPEPEPVDEENYEFGHYYDMYGGNMSYDDWYESFDPCTLSPAEPYYTEEKISFALQQWGPPILIILGLVGNIMSAVILSAAGRNRLSCYLYLALLGVTDSLVLITRSGSDWVRSILLLDITNWILTQSNATCEVYSFFTSFLYHMCSWLVVLPVAEMAVISRNYTKAHKICTTSRVKHTVLLTVFFVVFLNAHFFFTFSLLGSKFDPMCGNTQCTFTPGGYGDSFRDWLWPILGDNISALLGPIFSIALCLVYIIGKPCCSDKGSKSDVNGIMDNHFIMDRHALYCFRRICIALSVFFLCTAIPEASYNMYEFILEKSGNNEFTDPTFFARRELVGTSSSFLRDLFLSTKPMIYLLCWNYFRKKVFCIKSCLSVKGNLQKTINPGRSAKVATRSRNSILNGISEDGNMFFEEENHLTCSLNTCDIKQAEV